MKKAKRLSFSLIFSKRNYAMYKCTLASERMTGILIKFYNVIVRKQYYPKRWLKVLDVMLDKGKEPLVRKLQTIQLIKADFQLIIRIFIGLRNRGSIEWDQRISKFNYRSRKRYNIEEVILKKRLLYDISR